VKSLTSAIEFEGWRRWTPAIFEAIQTQKTLTTIAANHSIATASESLLISPSVANQEKPKTPTGTPAPMAMLTQAIDEWRPPSSGRRPNSRAFMRSICLSSRDRRRCRMTRAVGTITIGTFSAAMGMRRGSMAMSGFLTNC